MERSSGTVAAVPLALALIGATMVGDTVTPDNGRRRRTAVTAAAVDVNQLPFTAEQRDWLKQHNPFGIPVSPLVANRTLIVRQGYTLAHNDVDLIADWVAFHLTKEFVNGTETRPGTSAFKPDRVLPVGRRAELTDYRGFRGIYDRGHQVASADSKGRGRSVIRESFLLSNMTPQASRLNQYRWRLFEERVQNIAASRGEVVVVTGPLFVDEDGDGTVEYHVIGDNEVAVPTHYFKVVVSGFREDEDIDAMAIIVPNEPTDQEFDIFLKSIDEVERLSGLNLFPEMPPETQNSLEANKATTLWDP